MTEIPSSASASPAPSGPAPQGLASRLLGVLFSPRSAFTAVAAHPKALGALAVTVVALAGSQGWLLSTPQGQTVMLDQQVRAMESFGVTVTDEMYSQMESRLSFAPLTTGLSQVVFIPVATAIVSGLVLALFGGLMGGVATFKQVYAVVAHAGVILAIQSLFTAPLTYVTGRFAGANLGVFAPTLEEASLPARFLGSIDLFVLWWAIVVAIGIAVVFKRGTGGIAAGLIGLYVAVAAVVALVRS